MGSQSAELCRSLANSLLSSRSKIFIWIKLLACLCIALLTPAVVQILHQLRQLRVQRVRVGVLRSRRLATGGRRHVPGLSLKTLFIVETDPCCVPFVILLGHWHEFLSGHPGLPRADDVPFGENAVRNRKRCQSYQKCLGDNQTKGKFGISVSVLILNF